MVTKSLAAVVMPHKKSQLISCDRESHADPV